MPMSAMMKWKILAWRWTLAFPVLHGKAACGGDRNVPIAQLIDIVEASHFSISKQAEASLALTDYHHPRSVLRKVAAPATEIPTGQYDSMAETMYDAPELVLPSKPPSASDDCYGLWRG